MTIQHDIGQDVTSHPATSIQEQLYFLNQLNPEDPAYTLVMTWEIRGSLSRPAAEQAIIELQRQHSTLRSTFRAARWDERRYVERLVVAKPLAGLKYADLSAFSAAEQDKALDRDLAVLVSIPFDLTRGPLMKCYLTKRSEGHFVLMLVVHHAIFDHESQRVFVETFLRLHDAFTECQAETTRKEPDDSQVEYFDAARRDSEESPALAHYWSRTLDGVPRPRSFPDAALLANSKRGTGRQHGFSIGAARRAGIAALAREQGASVFILEDTLHSRSTLCHCLRIKWNCAQSGSKSRKKRHQSTLCGRTQYSDSISKRRPPPIRWELSYVGIREWHNRKPCATYRNVVTSPAVDRSAGI